MNEMAQSRHFMQMALEQAALAERLGEVPVGAVVVKDGDVIAVGHNQPIGSHDPTAHAEIVALRAAALALGNYRLDGCTLYVTLEPCAMCAGAILEARVQRVIYGAREPRTGAAGSVFNLFEQTKLNHHTTVTSGVLEAESTGLLTGFFSERRRAHKMSAQPLREDGLRTPAACFASVDASFPESKYVRVGDEDLQWRFHYVDAGPEDATTCVVLVHDVPGWGHRWLALLPVLAQAGFRVLAPDLLGFGRSDKPKKKQAHSLPLHLQCLDSLLALVPEKSQVVFVGQGVGQRLASHWALKKTGRGGGVIAIAPSQPQIADAFAHPDRGFMAGLDFFTEWAQVNSSESIAPTVSYMLDTPGPLLARLKSLQGAG